MYQTGTIGDYQDRLHQMPLISGATSGNLVSFIIEGREYLKARPSYVSGQLVSGVTPQTSGQWEKEVRMHKYRMTHNGFFLNQQQF